LEHTVFRLDPVMIAPSLNGMRNIERQMEETRCHNRRALIVNIVERWKDNRKAE
jgi:hypothetical protein